MRVRDALLVIGFGGWAVAERRRRQLAEESLGFLVADQTEATSRPDATPRPRLVLDGSPITQGRDPTTGRVRFDVEVRNAAAQAAASVSVEAFAAGAPVTVGAGEVVTRPERIDGHSRAFLRFSIDPFSPLLGEGLPVRWASGVRLVASDQPSGVVARWSG
jgi:hypothetical protein